MSSFSLWFVPGGEFFRYYRDIIAQLSSRFHSEAFTPHATLLGSIEGQPLEIVLKKTTWLAGTIRPPRLEIDGVGYEDHFTRSLYFRVRPTQELALANHLAREYFDLEDPISYMPHLSLLYANLPANEKEELAPSFKKDPKGYFIPKNISLWETKGKVSEWKLLKEFPLKPGV